MTEEMMTTEEQITATGGAGTVESPPSGPRPENTNHLPPADDRFAVEYDEDVADRKPDSSAPTNGQAPPWAAVESVGDLLGLDEVRDELQQRDAERAAQTRAEIEAEYKRRNRSRETDDLINRIGGHFGRVLQQLQEGDAAGAEGMIDKLEPLIDKVTARARDEAMWAGVMAQGQATTAVLTSKLGRDEREEFQDYLSKGEGTPIGDAVDAYTRLKTKPVLQRKDAEIARLNDVIGRIKAEGRTGQGPNLAQSASGGGDSINSLAEAERRYILPSSHPQHIDHATFKEYRQRFGVKDPWA